MYIRFSTIQWQSIAMDDTVHESWQCSHSWGGPVNLAILEIACGSQFYFANIKNVKFKTVYVMFYQDIEVEEIYKMYRNWWNIYIPQMYFGREPRQAANTKRYLLGSGVQWRFSEIQLQWYVAFVTFALISLYFTNIIVETAAFVWNLNVQKH